MTYENHCKEILDLFRATGKEVPHEDSNIGRAVQILQTICDSQSHTIPMPDDFDPEESTVEEYQENVSSEVSEIFDALEELRTMLGESDYNFEFNGNEYRLIEFSESNIWPIYRDEIQSLVEECYSDVLKLDQIPNFIAISVDWEQTAQNAYADGYGHHFSGYDGSEEEAGGYYIFRTN